jgi:hypothetical protein
MQFRRRIGECVFSVGNSYIRPDNLTAPGDFLYFYLSLAELISYFLITLSEW